MAHFIPVILTDVSVFLSFLGSLISKYYVFDSQPSLVAQAFSSLSNYTTYNRTATTETGQHFLSDPLQWMLKDV
jgi:hypothetical protein